MINIVPSCFCQLYLNLLAIFTSNSIVALLGQINFKVYQCPTMILLKEFRKMLDKTSFLFFLFLGQLFYNLFDFSRFREGNISIRICWSIVFSIDHL